jgi:hypothetical protein
LSLVAVLEQVLVQTEMLAVLAVALVDTKQEQPLYL